MQTTQLAWLAKACAMNHRKNGGLKFLSISKCFSGYTTANSFYEAFKISDHDHEIWYGDKKVAKDMQKEQLEKKFVYGLEYLNV